MAQFHCLFPPPSSVQVQPFELTNGKQLQRAPKLFFLPKSLPFHSRLILSRNHFLFLSSTMSTNQISHVFAGSPIRSKTPKSTDPFSPTSAFQTLKSLLLGNTQEPSSPNFKLLPFMNGRPLTGSNGGLVPNWHLGWLSWGDCKGLLENSEIELIEDKFVYLGSKPEAEDDVVYWAIDVSEGSNLVDKFGSRECCFVELRTLMVATDWADSGAMGELAVAGHGRALLEWHNTSRFCGNCGEKTVPTEAGRRKQCMNESCKKRIYPRVDPVVIMLVIDEKNDHVILSRQSRSPPRMWSCLAGFLEPGESLEEAVRRETWEETGIEVGEVVYHSSQPWPDAKWCSREDVKKALNVAEYEKAQRASAAKVDQMCKGVLEKAQSLSTDFNLESGELAPLFVPGPFAIAHHLISSWANQVSSLNSVETQMNHPSGSLSNS